MSDTLLQEYKAYYNTRAERFSGNENYKHSYEAEKELSNAMQSCSTLEEFKNKMGNLNEKCAIAYTKDRSIIEQKHFEKHQEIVRALASKEILDKIDECKTSLELIELVSNIENQNNIRISIDEAHREFIYHWELIDEYIIYKNAVVPDEYKSDMQESCNDFLELLRDDIQKLEENNNEWQENWKIIPEKNLEYRHRRLIPFSDAHIQEQIQRYKLIINR